MVALAWNNVSWEFIWQKFYRNFLISLTKIVVLKSDYQMKCVMFTIVVTRTIHLSYLSGTCNVRSA